LPYKPITLDYSPSTGRDLLAINALEEERGLNREYVRRLAVGTVEVERLEEARRISEARA